MTNQTFNAFDLEHATLEDFMTVETPMTDSEINDAIQYAVDYTNEIAEIELQDKLADATYPRNGYTSAQVFENEEEYEAWLRGVLAEEASEYRQDLFNMVKVESDLYHNLETIETVDQTGATMQDDYIADCPICGRAVTTDDDGDLDHCHHFLGTFNGWYEDDEIQRDLASQATHRVVWSTSVAGNPEAYFKTSLLDDVMTASEAEEEFGITRDTVHKSIQSGRLPSRQSGKTHLFLRSDAVKLWKSIFIIAMFAGWLVQYLNS